MVPNWLSYNMHENCLCSHLIFKIWKFLFAFELFTQAFSSEVDGQSFVEANSRQQMCSLALIFQEEFAD